VGIRSWIDAPLVEVRSILVLKLWHVGLVTGQCPLTTVGHEMTWFSPSPPLSIPPRPFPLRLAQNCLYHRGEFYVINAMILFLIGKRPPPFRMNCKFFPLDLLLKIFSVNIVVNITVITL
jgi:hypothetical protein